MQFKGIQIIRAEELIPRGNYCYTMTDPPSSENGFRLKTKLCPFWSNNPDQPDQGSGYCSYLKQGDWMENGTSLLWDQVKECGVNPAPEEDM